MIFLWFIPITIAVIFVFRWIFRKTPEEIEYQRKLNENLADEHIIDPETGAKLTLDQAETGLWIDHNNEHYEMPEEEIDKLYTEEEKNREKAANVLRANTEFKRCELDNDFIDLLLESAILRKYDDWKYSHCFWNESADIIIFFPIIEIHSRVYSHYPDNFSLTQIMVCLKLKEPCGRYYLKEEGVVDNVFNHLNKEAKTFLPGYVTIILQPSDKVLFAVQKIQKLEGIEGLEIEVFQDNLFVKTTTVVSRDSLVRLMAVLNH